MALFGKERDISLFRHLNKELLHNIIETTIGFYKIDLVKTSSNIYGESKDKIYNNPVLIPCYIDRQEPSGNNSVNLPDRTRSFEFKFLRDDLFAINVIPEQGDIIMYNENYYETDLVIENQFFMNKNPDYAYVEAAEKFGTSLSIILKTHQIRIEIPGITQSKL